MVWAFVPVGSAIWSRLQLLTLDCCAHAETVDMTMDVGPDICKKAQEIQAKSVLLLHHGKGMIRDLIFGSVTSYTSRNCKRPLMLFRAKNPAS